MSTLQKLLAIVHSKNRQQFLHLVD